MQVDQPKGSAVKAITTVLAVGDEVSYVKVAASGHGYRLSAQKGVIVGIDGNVAILRAGNGRHTTQPLNKLTPADQPNTLTQIVMGVRSHG